MAGEEAAERRAAEERAEAGRRAELDALPDDEIRAELGLPDPDTLQPGDDVSGFMARAVPDRLRRRALRKLWTSNPVLANIDGLVEYGEDYTDAATVVENLQTAYQIGKGLIGRGEPLAEEEEAVDDGGGTGDAPEGRAGDGNGDEQGEEPEAMDQDMRISTREDLPGRPAVPPEPSGPAAPRPRMRFTFPGEEA